MAHDETPHDEHTSTIVMRVRTTATFQYVDQVGCSFSIPIAA